MGAFSAKVVLRCWTEGKNLGFHHVNNNYLVSLEIVFFGFLKTLLRRTGGMHRNTVKRPWAVLENICFDQHFALKVQSTLDGNWKNDFILHVSSFAIQQETILI